MRSDGSVAAAQLLQIDLREELAKVPGATVADDAELAVEAVRWLLSRGARRVAVNLARGRLEAVAAGAGAPPRTLLQLETLRDESLDPLVRHSALTALERDDPGLLALAGVRAASLSIGQRDGGDHARQLTVWLRLPSAHQRRLREALGRACRHAAIPISVDAVPVSGEAGARPGDCELPAPLRGRWAIAEVDDVSRVVLLVHGIRAAEVVLDELPGLSVALDVEPSGPGAAAAREAFAAVRPTLVEALQAGLADSGQRLPGLPPESARRLRCAILQIATTRPPRPDLLDAPLLPACTGAGPRHLSLRDLMREAENTRRSGRRLPALFPGDPPPRIGREERPVWRLDARERTLAGELTGARFAPLPPPTGVSRWSGLRRRLAAIRDRLHALWRRPGRPVPSAVLRPEERALLHAFDDSTPQRPLICDGSGPPVDGARRLLLPRRHPRVAEALRRLRERPEDAYVAALALGGGPGAAARERWRARLAGPQP